MRKHLLSSYVPLFEGELKGRSICIVKEPPPAPSKRGIKILIAED